MKSNRCFLLLGLSFLLLLASCGSTESAVTTIPATESPIAADMLVPTDAPLPTEAPSPPTQTPQPQPEDRTWPTRRYSHYMAYDPRIDRVLLFNGYDEKIGGWGYERLDADTLARDEWAYDVTQNRMEFLRTAPYTVYNMAAYDEQSHQLIAFGADNTAVYNPDRKAWEKTEPAAEPGTWRFGFGLAYDSQSDRTILFGGGDLEGLSLDDTWAYDYETNTWTEMSPEVSPPRREYHAMAYDAESDRIILWGANEGGRTPMSDDEKATVWAYDYDANTWTPIESAGGPSYRGGHTMVYHHGTDRIIMFGGHSKGDVNFSDESWAYDYNSNTWTKLAPANHPSGRRYHTMVYAEGADKMVLFGGMAGNFLKEETSDELWIFDPVLDEWSQVMPDSLNP